jgi:hypothetical protein
MAYIAYVDSEHIPEQDRVDDTDNILRIRGVHNRVMRLHEDLSIIPRSCVALPGRGRHSVKVVESDSMK